MEQIDNIIRKQLILENLLKTTKNSNKSIYTLQLKVWIKCFTDGVMSYQTVSNLLDHRIKELKCVISFKC